MPAIEAMPLPPGVTELLLQASTATITMQLLKRGFRGLAINGVRPMNPAAARFAGPAVTLRYIPGREDICQAPKPTDPDSAQRIAIEGTPAGHVLVIGTEREIRAGTLGDILAWRLKMRGIAAVVSDGAMRDAPVMAGIDLPIFAAANAAPASMTNLHPVEVQVPIGCGGVPVFPGDALVGDLDGVVVIPATWWRRSPVIPPSRSGWSASCSVRSGADGRSAGSIRRTTRPRPSIATGSRPASRRTDPRPAHLKRRG